MVLLVCFMPWRSMGFRMPSATAIEPAILRLYAGDQLVTLSKLVGENAFHPIVEVATGTVFGYETLMRGYDRIGFGSPLELLDEAHEAGQLLALEQMIAARALAKFATLPDFASATLFVNLDVRQDRKSTRLNSSH